MRACGIDVFYVVSLHKTRTLMSSRDIYVYIYNFFHFHTTTNTLEDCFVASINTPLRPLPETVTQHGSTRLVNAPLTKPYIVSMQQSREAVLAREACAQTLMARGQASEALHYYQVRGQYYQVFGKALASRFLHCTGNTCKIHVVSSSDV